MAQGQHGKQKRGKLISASRVVFLTVLSITQKLAYVSWGQNKQALSTFIQHGGRVVGDNPMRQ